MRSRQILAMAAACAALAAACPGRAQEIRLGVGYAPHGPETSASMVVDYVFESPKALKFAAMPRPDVGVQVSLGGDTDFAQAGLLWRKVRGRGYLDLGAGLAVHNGALSLPHPKAGVSDAENQRRRRDLKEKIEFESRVQFHATFALGLRLDEHWAVELEGQHWSNGRFASDTHDGADSLGLRTAYRF